MEVVAEGLWRLADYHEKRGEVGKAVKCLEAICQSQVSFFPIVEVKTRLRIASLLLNHFHNVNHAKSHLERSQLLLKSIPSCFELKCRAFSLLSQCYHLVGAIPPQKQILNKGLELTASSADGFSVKLWSCNFNSQLANALIIEGDYQNSIYALEHGYICAAEMCYPELQMFFATSILHVHLMQWEDVNLVEKALSKCDEVWDSIEPHKVSNELKETVSVGIDRQAWRDKLDLAPPPIDGEWLPRAAVYVLVDLMVVIFGRPKGLFKECGKRIQSGLQSVQEELLKLGISDGVREVDLQHSAIWMAGVYLMLLMQFLENKVAVELTRSEFVEAQEALVQMRNWFVRFPTILQACESVIEMLRGQYAHSVGCFSEAAFHFIEAAKDKPRIPLECKLVKPLRSHELLLTWKNSAPIDWVAKPLTESKSMEAMCKVYAAVSYICIGDAESSSQALEIIGPLYRVMDSYVGVREKTSVLFAYGLLLMKQHNLQEAR
ncbi:Chromatid cohesion factor MAU2 [Dillenia turbinata]|uniref:Chromatid cohesion factor MAU2 n=1 Tax=Dillenia turbinata TaxID=194707 RepID=A0AAN8UE30_9MAGN